MTALLVFLGGGLGALARLGLNEGISKLTGDRFPLGILACNVLGCFLIGLASGYLSRSAPSWFTPLIMIGFLGGFTTFSTFARDTVNLFTERGLALAAANILLSVCVCLFAVLLGLKLSQTSS
ncbi:MAG: fluoride efflux transporter CrcB [Verrucomicrobiota bacterium]